MNAFLDDYDASQTIVMTGLFHLANNVSAIHRHCVVAMQYNNVVHSLITNKGLQMALVSWLYDVGYERAGSMARYHVYKYKFGQECT